jgi:hypothetical protein
MKKLFIIIVILICFQSLSKADDIRDFQLEGISVGDSLLDHFSKKKINENRLNYDYGKKGFYATSFYKEKFFDKYESLEIHLKDNDNSFLIYSVDALIFYDNIDDCYKKQNEIKDSISSIFENTKRIDAGFKKLNGDKSGKSTTKAYYWQTKEGFVTLECYDWSNEITEKSSWADNLRISVINNELNNWLTN